MDGNEKTAAQRNAGGTKENPRWSEEELLRLYMELTGCDEREARSTYMHVEPADDEAAVDAGRCSKPRAGKDNQGLETA